MNYLVSYPHSGNTLIRYFVELLTGVPTTGHNPSSISERFEENVLNVDSTKEPILIKRHEIAENEITRDDVFILILRSSKECIKENYEEEYEKYINLIRQYDAHKGEKRIIFYRNVLKDVLKETKEILEFINFEGEINEDIDVEFHKEQSLSVYRNKIGEPGCNC